MEEEYQSFKTVTPDTAIHCIWYMTIYLLCYGFYILKWRLKNARFFGRRRYFHASCLQAGLLFRPPTMPSSAPIAPSPTQRYKGLGLHRQCGTEHTAEVCTVPQTAHCVPQALAGKQRKQHILGNLRTHLPSRKNKRRKKQPSGIPLRQKCRQNGEERYFNAGKADDLAEFHLFHIFLG